MEVFKKGTITYISTFQSTEINTILYNGAVEVVWIVKINQW